MTLNFLNSPKRLPSSIESMGPWPIDRNEHFWTCPVNIGGLAQESVTRLFNDDLFTLLQPTVSSTNDPDHAFQKRREMGHISYGHLHDVVERRVSDLTKFLRQSGLALKANKELSKGNAPVHFNCLAGDSHNGGKRPLMFELEANDMVLKFADPRPYQLLANTLNALSNDIGVDLAPPPIIADPENHWYFLPYLGANHSSCNNIENFMFAIGALTAAAYCLRMSDIHLENLLVFEGKPIIIDPECILYNFMQEDDNERLQNTGLVGHNPHMSALRGGDLSKQNVFRIGLLVRDDGALDYRKPVLSFHNRVRESNGRLADPADFRETVSAGYATAFNWFVTHADFVCDVIQTMAVDDFQIRFLMRKTKLYASVIHMLNLPFTDHYQDWQDSVFQRFSFAGHFPDKVDEKSLAAELYDMEARDIPYFWVNAGEKVIRHRTGVVQNLQYQNTPREQAINDVQNLHQSNLKTQIELLEKFLNVDMCSSFKSN